MEIAQMSGNWNYNKFDFQFDCQQMNIYLIFWGQRNIFQMRHYPLRRIDDDNETKIDSNAHLWGNFYSAINWTIFPQVIYQFTR